MRKGEKKTQARNAFCRTTRPGDAAPPNPDRRPCRQTINISV